MHTKFLSFLIIGSALCASALAEGKGSNLDFTSNVLSGYTDIDGQRYYTKSVSQSELIYSLPHGFYVDDWFSSGVNFRTSDATENEFWLGWTRESASGVIVDVAAAYYDFAPLFKGVKGDMYSVYAKVGKSYTYDMYAKLTPAIEFYGYRPAKGSDFDGGVRFRVSAEYEHKLLDTDLTVTPAIVHDNGTFGTPSAWVGSIEFALSWHIKALTIKLPMISVYAPISSRSGRETSAVYGVGIEL